MSNRAVYTLSILIKLSFYVGLLKLFTNIRTKLPGYKMAYLLFNILSYSIL